MTILKRIRVLSQCPYPTDTSAVLVEVEAIRRLLENTHEGEGSCYCCLRSWQLGVVCSLYHALSQQVYTPVCPVSCTCSGSESVPNRLFVVQFPRE
jgi:hypothetical protein